MPPLDRPIFIVGPHRSGTTLLYDVLGRHPDLGWFDRGNKRLPWSPRAARLLSRLRGPSGPSEAQTIWDRAARSEDDVLDASAATAAVSARYRELVLRTLALRGAPRFLAKYPRLSLRLAWLDAVFPEARFVHVTRDWRAVVASTVRRQIRRSARGGGWFGVRIPGWRALDGVAPELAAVTQFATVTEVLERAAGTYGGRLVRASYEDLCADPVRTTRGLCVRLGLRWTAGFEKSIPVRRIVSANDKWRTEMDEAAVERLRDEYRALLVRHEESAAPERVPAPVG